MFARVPDPRFGGAPSDAPTASLLGAAQVDITNDCRLMALAYSIDEALNLIVITGEYADAPEWERLMTLVLADPRRRPGCIVLRDQRGGTIPVDAAMVVAIMDVVRRFWPKLGIRRAAILMQRERDSPALVAHAIADEDNLPIRAFTSYDLALEWLTQTGHLADSDSGS